MYSSSSSRNYYPSLYLSFYNSFWKAVSPQGVTDPVSIPYFYYIMIFLLSFTLRSASSFLTRSVQLIFSILLQHHISKLSRYFWPLPKCPTVSTTQNYVQLSAPHKIMSNCQHHTKLCLTVSTTQNYVQLSAPHKTMSNCQHHTKLCLTVSTTQNYV